MGLPVPTLQPRFRTMRQTPTAVLAVTLLAVQACGPARAAPPAPTPPPEEAREARETPPRGLRPYRQVVPASAVTDSGLFTLHRVDGRLLYEIPDSMLGRDMLLISQLAAVPPDFGGFMSPGINTAQQVVRWERQGNRVLLRTVSYRSVAADTLPIYRSVRSMNLAPIIRAFDIETTPPGGGAVVVNVTRLFEEDVTAISGFSNRLRSQWGVRRLDGSRSFIDEARSFPLNVEVRHTLTFEAANPPSEAHTSTISVQLNQSMVLLPAEPMRPRLADPRVGWFTIQQVDYGLDEQKAATRALLRRWRLEPSDPEAYARGELVTPVQPIVFYIDPATPDEWRPWVRKGIEDWQPAFETAGFRDAIVARDAPSPDDDPDFSLEDVRFSTVRYVASLTRNALGPSVSDPRSGEIISSDVIWFHNHLRSYRNRLLIETGGANPAITSLRLPHEELGEAVRAVIAHEVGHAIGLPHNMIASSSFPVDSLRSPTFTERMGVAPTIMDYARQNYVAQPGDGVSRFIRKLGPYDHYAVNWGYRVIPGASSPEEERPVLDRWIRERAGDPVYRFGQPSAFPPIDPNAQTEDLGDDPVRASGYGVANLKRVVPRLVEWTSSPGSDYEDLREVYDELIGAWSRYMGHVVTNVGGVHETRKASDQPGPVYEPVAGDRQRASVRFLAEELFATPAWLNDPEILARIEHGGALERIRRVQATHLNSLLHPQRMQRLVEAALFPGADAYPLTAFMDDVRDAVWGELRTGAAIDAFRRSLQRAHIARLEELLTGNPAGGGGTPVDVAQSDVRPAARAQLARIQRDARARAATAPDAMTRNHLHDVVARIEGALRVER
jgi:hypothetical protein